jgi:DNA-binding response OmpR family regulator
MACALLTLALIREAPEGTVIVEGRKLAVLLVVEDDHEMRSLLCDELWGEGYHLREAKNGDEALVAVMESTPDLILTDLKMPAGGLDYVNRLRTFAPQCPIILMTAFGDTQLKAAALRSGATAYFDKPVRVSALKATIKELLSNHKSRPG